MKKAGLVVGVIAVVVAIFVLVYTMDRPEAPVAVSPPAPVLTELAEPEPEVPAEEVAVVATPTPEPAPTPVPRATPVIEGPTVTFTGTVTLEDGSPVSSARVEIVPVLYSHKEVDFFDVSAADGTYRIEAPEYYFHNLKATKDGYAVATGYSREAEVGRIMNDPSAGSESRREVTMDFILVPEALITGRVVDEAADPIPGAIVSSTSAVPLMDSRLGRINRASRVEATADAEGRFDLHGAPAGEVFLAASAEGFAPMYEKKSVPAEDVLLTMKRGGSTVAGMVYLLGTNETVSSATVNLYFTSSGPVLVPLEFQQQRSTLTDESGQFRIEGLAPGDYILTAEKDSLRNLRESTESSRVTVGENDEQLGISMFLYPGHSIRGVVRESGTDTPIEGVTVATDGWQMARPGKTDAPMATTDQDGFYRMTGLFGSQASVVAQKEGYVQEKTSNAWSAAVQVPLTPDELEVTQDLTMVRTLTISGVVEFENGAPASSARLQFVQQRSSGRESFPAGPDGTFEIEVPPMSEGSIRAEVPGHPIAVSEAIKVRFDSVEGVRVVVGKAAEVSGVVKSPHGTPLEGATVTGHFSLPLGDGVRRNENVSPVITDALGRFRLGELPPREFQIHAEAEGFAQSAEQTLTLTSGERREGVELMLRESHFLAGTVVDAEEAPVSGATLHVYTTSGGFNNQVKTDENGRFRVDDVPDLPFRGSIFHNGTSHMLSKIEIDNEDQVIVIGAEEGATLIGRVVDDATGDLVETFKVAKDGRSGGKRIYIDPDTPGQFKWEGLKPNWRQVVVITAEGYSTYTSDSIDVSPGQKEIHKTFRLGSGGIVRGRVVDKESREPVAGAYIPVYQGRNLIFGYGVKPINNGRSDEEGNFEITGLQPGELTVLVETSEYPSKTVNALTTHGKVTDLGDIELDSGDSLALRAVDEISGQPVSGIEIELFRGPRYVGDSLGRKSTDQNGNALYAGIVDGQYYAELPGPSFYVNLDPQAAIATSSSDDGISTLSIPVGRTTLKGTVLKGGKPYIVGVNASSRDREPSFTRRSSITTDEDGKFEIPNLLSGQWSFRFSEPGDYQSSQSIVAEIPPSGVYEHTFTISEALLNVTVVDAEGNPVPAAAITGKDSEGNVLNGLYPRETDANGVYAYRGLSEGTYHIEAVHDEKGRAELDIPMGEEETKDVTLTLVSGGGTLVSLAYEYETGGPMKSAWVKLKDTDGNPVTTSGTRDDMGKMVVSNIPAGTYSVEVSAWDYSEGHHTVEIEEGKTAEIEDVLFPAGTLHWRILDKAGKAQVDMPYRVTALDPDSLQQPITGRTDKDGDAYVRGVWPGNYHAEVTVNGKLYEITIMLEKMGTNKATTTVD